jgi:hypothetical protein
VVRWLEYEYEYPSGWGADNGDHDDNLYTQKKRHNNTTHGNSNAALRVLLNWTDSSNADLVNDIENMSRDLWRRRKSDFSLFLFCALWTCYWWCLVTAHSSFISPFLFGFHLGRSYGDLKRQQRRNRTCGKTTEELGRALLVENTYHYWTCLLVPVIHMRHYSTEL